MSDYQVKTIRLDTKPSVEQVLLTTINDSADEGFELHTLLPYEDRIIVITARHHGTEPQIRTQRT